MKIEGTHTFNAPRDLVWTMLLEPEVLANVMPGCEKLEAVAENQYTGILKIRIGPVQGKFNGKITLSNIESPESYDVVVDGKGAPGIVKGTGSMQLAAAGNQTVMTYQGDVQVSGRIASVGQRLLETSAKAIIQQSLDGLAQQVQVRMAPVDVETAVLETETVAPQPPSQMQFATGVAKNMLADFVPEENREAVVQKVVAGVVALFFLRLYSEWLSNRIARKVVRQLRDKTLSL